jgi:integrator complex subunit 4
MQLPEVDLSLYSEVCACMKDDYEECRIMGMKLLMKLSKSHGECFILSSNCESTRLIDDVFCRICSMMSDNCLAVRVIAAQLLGDLKKVSPCFLHQTLDKKLMSNLREKKNAHSRLEKETVSSSSGFSSGKKWADDAPQESLCPEEINLMDIGSCGAFLIGLEDEFKEVRMASLTSMTKLAKDFEDFAKESLDFLIDMFNDEIIDIRLAAITLLSSLDNKLVLREDQVTMILAAFQDNSLEIRLSLYDLLGKSKLSTKDSLRSSIEVLLTNLEKFGQQDKLEIWRCLSQLGKSHPEMVCALTTELLGIHPFLMLSEPSIEDDAYVSLMMIVLNAASLQESILSQLEDYSRKHYGYLRWSYPALVPRLPCFEKDCYQEENDSVRFPLRVKESHSFLLKIFSRIRDTMKESMESQKPLNLSILQLSIQDLQMSLSTHENPSHSFLTLYLQCQVSLLKILQNNNWINALLLAQSSSFRSLLHKILSTTLTLKHKFHGMSHHQMTLIQETRVKGLALQLMAIIHGSNASALSLCHAFLTEVEDLKRRHQQELDEKPDLLTQKMILSIEGLSEPKPGSVARLLMPIFLQRKHTVPDNIHTMLLGEGSLDSLVKLRLSHAEILEPRLRSDVVFKFTAGLVFNITVKARVRNIEDVSLVKVRVKYPDNKTMLHCPKTTDFVVMEEVSSIKGVHSFHLQTNVFLTHQVWTEAASIEMTLVLDLKDQVSSVSQVWADKTKAYNRVKADNEDCLQIPLHDPFFINILPRPAKKTVI